MDIGSIYHFLFETMPGNGVMIAVVLVLSLVISIILERRTRKIYTNHEPSEDDWFAFDDDEENADKKEN